MNNQKHILNEHMFSDEEKIFIKKYNLHINDFYDGRGETKNERHDNAKRNGKMWVLSDVPCRNAGHRLRTRSGHCMQCNPSVIKYMSRNERPGIIYLAVSSDDYIKIGLIENNSGDSMFSIKNRKGSLNGYDGYGGHNGWDIISSWQVPKAGKIENVIHDKLKDFSCNSEYFHGDKIQMSKELFKCTIQTALSVIENTIFQKGNI